VLLVICCGGDEEEEEEEEGGLSTDIFRLLPTITPGSLCCSSSIGRPGFVSTPLWLQFMTIPLPVPEIKR
jgi:hypothetical protein